MNTTTTHPYFMAKAQSFLGRHGGDPAVAGALAVWASQQHDPRVRVIVAADGRLLAETRNVRGGPSQASASYVTRILDPQVIDAEPTLRITSREEGLSLGSLERLLGQVIVATTSDVCCGPAPHRA